MNSNQEIEKFIQDFLNQQNESQNPLTLQLEKDYRTKENSVNSDIKKKTRCFRDTLIENGFLEAEKYVESRLWKWKYYKQTSADVAFIVNLEAYEDYIEIYYGYTSTSFTKMHGSENTLKELGVDSVNINVRNMIQYKLNDNEELIKNEIKDFYLKYLKLSKDEILSLKKDKQKIFINKIKERLQPLGFKKKNSIWTKNIVKDLCFEFDAQKSQFSDEYYFNIRLYHADLKYTTCYDTRLSVYDKNIFDWQILTDAEINEILDVLINKYLLLIMNTPLKQLSKDKNDNFKLSCKKNLCKDCFFK